MDQRRRQGAIDDQLLALHGAIRRAQAKQRAKAKAQARAWVLGVSLLRVVVLIYWLADGVVDPAVFYLRQRECQHHWPDKDDEEFADLVEQVIADTADADVLAMNLEDDRRGSTQGGDQIRAAVAPSNMDISSKPQRRSCPSWR